MNRQVILWVLFLMSVFIMGSCDSLLSTEEESVSAVSGASHLHYLGKGYDVFDSYADSTAIKSTILDAEVLYNAGLLELTLEENSITYDMNGESVDEYLSSYDIHAGVSTDYGLFSGTLTAKFGSAEFSSTTRAYATYSSSVRKFKEKVKNEYNNANALRPYVQESVLARLNNCETVEDAKDFFSIYGTHVIVWAYQGARVDYHATTTSSDYSSASDFSADVTASYKGLSTDDSYSSSSEYNSFESKAKTELQIYGGPSQYANSILSGDFSLWEEGVGDSSTWTLCDFGQDDNIDSLMPVWELCSGDDDGIDEAALFEEAFEDWADDNAINITEAEPTSYTITFTLDHVGVYIDDNEDGEAEFRGKLRIDGMEGYNKSSVPKHPKINITRYQDEKVRQRI